MHEFNEKSTIEQLDNVPQLKQLCSHLPLHIPLNIYLYIYLPYKYGIIRRETLKRRLICAPYLANEGTTSVRRIDDFEAPTLPAISRGLEITTDIMIIVQKHRNKCAPLMNLLQKSTEATMRHTPMTSVHLLSPVIDQKPKQTTYPYAITIIRTIFESFSLFTCISFGDL